MAAEHSRRNSGGFFFIFVVFNTETNLTIHVLITISFLFFGVFFFVFSIIEKKDEQIPRKISLKKKVSFFFVLVNRQEKDERFFAKFIIFFSNATPSFAKFSFWVHRREKDFQNLWDNFIEKNKNVATVSIRSLRWTIHLNIKLFLLFLMIIF